MWPDNLPAINVLTAMHSQWQRAGMDGVPTGLRYESLPLVFRMVGVPRAEQADTFECLRVLESEALKIMSEQK